MKLVVVFDTSVLFSAIGSGGKPGQCVPFARDGPDEMHCEQATPGACSRYDGPYRSRTDTPFRAMDFESIASANSAKGP